MFPKTVTNPEIKPQDAELRDRLPKILIANRGEIAVRICRTCRRLGIATVAVYSEADARSLHLREADQAVCIGPAPATHSYLDGEKIVAAALAHGCRAVHPGYGFLSENAEFARRVTEAGLIFIGPKAAVIAAMGDKIQAKQLAARVGVPVVPGHDQALTEQQEIEEVAATLGYPVIFKPAAGGGGRGMRVVKEPSELAAALSQARDETRKAFADDRIFLDRYLTNPRHIEIQIIADHHGRVLALGERDCSIQRRHQKVIEEAPSPALSPEQRRQMQELACALAREAGYTNAGTVEFILAENHEFFFMEMNTRLQVEHPVTELITGLDLVELQLRVAAGEPLPLSQEEVKLDGWAIEARICAEEPARDFLPATGIITRYSPCHGRNIRLDSGIEAGSRVSVHYDSLLAKVISYGRDREEARLGLIQALNRYHLEGVATNLDFANAILNHPVFQEGNFSTGFIAEHFRDGQARLAPPREQLAAMVIAVTLVYHNRQNLMRQSLRPLAARIGATPRPEKGAHYRVKEGENAFAVELHGTFKEPDWDFIIIDDQSRPEASGHKTLSAVPPGPLQHYRVVTPDFEFYRRRLKLEINGRMEYFRLQYHENFIQASFGGLTRLFEIYSPREWELARFMPAGVRRRDDKQLLSPLPGMVVRVLAQPGERVYRGQDLLVIESMKMESGVSSPRDGLVGTVHCRTGTAVNTGDPLLTFAE